jgi:hypothetical protein
VPEIEKMKPAYEHTIGRGLYGTYGPEMGAIDYALLRARIASSKRGATVVHPVLYEITATEINMLDLRSDDSAEEILAEFTLRLEQWLEEAIKTPSDPLRLQEGGTKKLIHKINDREQHRYRLLKETSMRSDLFTATIEDLGFQGLIVREGGEGDIGDHESWVIFDPSKAKVTAEEQFKDPQPLAIPPELPQDPTGNWWG